MDTRLVLVLLFIVSVDCSRFITRQYEGRRVEKPDKKAVKTRGEVMENLFNLYDPSFLSLVWPKIANGVHLRLGLFCWEDVGVFFRDLVDGRAWAYNSKF
jgi:hypothetical protein